MTTVIRTPVGHADGVAVYRWLAGERVSLLTDADQWAAITMAAAAGWPRHQISDRLSVGIVKVDRILTTSSTQPRASTA